MEFHQIKTRVVQQCVLAFQAGHHNQLFHGRIVPNVAPSLRVGSAPFLGGHPKQRFVQNVCLVGIHKSDLRASELGRDQMFFDGVRMNPVLHFCQRAADAPLNPAGKRLLLFETLEFLDQVQLGGKRLL